MPSDEGLVHCEALNEAEPYECLGLEELKVYWNLKIIPIPSQCNFSFPSSY